MGTKAVFLSIAFGLFCSAWGAAPKRVAPSQPALNLKRVIDLRPIQNRYIELADPKEPIRVYGENIYHRLIARLMASGDFAVLTSDPKETAQLAAQSATGSLAEYPPDPCFVRPHPIASTKVQIQINELSFISGSRALRQMTGFTSRFQNSYNAGIDPRNLNEFSIRTDLQGGAALSHFGQAFQDWGGLRDGMDLGEEVNFDLIWAGAKVKYMTYDATMALNVAYENRVGGNETKILSANGKGFFLDVSAHLWVQGADFAAGLMAARKAALLDAFDRAIDQATENITAQLRNRPLFLEIGGQCGGDAYLAAGADYRIAPAQRFYNLTQLENGISPEVLVAQQVFGQSTRVTREDGSRPHSKLHDVLVSLAPGESVPQPSIALASQLAVAPGPSFENLSLQNKNIETPTPLLENIFTRIWQALRDLVTLPYRIYRYFQYDQKFSGGELKQLTQSMALQFVKSKIDSFWGLQSIGWPEYLEKCSGNACLGARRVIVAVLDSGVDYNHADLRRNIYWDGIRNTPGFDFFSYDERPYDDHAHGTEISSVIAGGGSQTMGVAPLTTILPVKIFSPFGQTNSAAIYSAFEYAVAQGARIIVAGWATDVKSKALEDGIRLAKNNGVLVVVAAGDSGVDLSKTPMYPAAFAEEYPNVLVVTAQERSGAVLRKERSANFGATVAMAAPGDDIVVARPRNGVAYASHSGIAAGFVAGAAALAQAHCLEQTGAYLSPEQVVSVLTQASVDDLGLRGEVLDNKALSIVLLQDSISRICKSSGLPVQ